VTEELPLVGRVGIVTGGGRGLGRAMALGLAQAGAAVIATAARERDEIERVADAAAAGCILPLLADVTREEDCARIVAAAIERFGRLDILINNAGRGMKYVSENFMTEPRRFWETPTDACLAAADRMYIMRNGEIRFVGRPDALITRESIEHAYFGFAAS
jgi:NAD(P)-dependent dehydrogenase (short-subunit alcohol dehydrogenase family)